MLILHLLSLTLTFSASMPVAFQAHPSKALQKISANTKIVFDVADSNVGKAYNIKDGVFTAPVHGVYVFHWTIMVHPGKYFATDLKVNGKIRARNHGKAQNNKDWYSPSQTYVGSLKQGEKVWLSTDGNPGQYLHPTYSTFSGYKL